MLAAKGCRQMLEEGKEDARSKMAVFHHTMDVQRERQLQKTHAIMYNLVNETPFQRRYASDALPHYHRVERESQDNREPAAREEGNGCEGDDEHGDDEDDYEDVSASRVRWKIEWEDGKKVFRRVDGAHDDSNVDNQMKRKERKSRSRQGDGDEKSKDGGEDERGVLVPCQDPSCTLVPEYPSTSLLLQSTLPPIPPAVHNAFALSTYNVSHSSLRIRNTLPPLEERWITAVDANSNEDHEIQSAAD